MVQDRTAKANQVRTLASEDGVVFPQGINELRLRLPEALEDPENGLSPVMRQLLSGLRDDIKWLDQDISDLETQIDQLCRQQPRYKALLKIPGFGPVLAAAFISDVGNGEQFSNGRQLSAWCGLVPSQHSSGGKSKLGSITKNGNTELRTLLAHGARAVLRYANQRQDPPGQWLKALIARRGRARAIIALANKMARIGWCISHGKDEFDVTKAFMVR
jgi:transposase